MFLGKDSKKNPDNHYLKIQSKIDCQHWAMLFAPSLAQ